jgi:hypothetical protein
VAITDAIKRAPRWAWITAGGVGLGAAGIKLWNNRAKEDEAAAEAASGDPLAPYPQTTTNPVATIVPPVIVSPSDNPGGAFGLQGLHDTYIGAIGSVMDGWERVWGPVQDAQLALLTGNAQALADLARAGSAPNSTPPVPPPELVPFPVPAVQQAPVALPAPAPAPAGPCTGKAPYTKYNPAKNDCYTVICARGTGNRRAGKWHAYLNPKNDQWMGPNC